METHIKAVGALSIGLSVLGILIGGFIFVLLAGIGFIVQDEEAAPILAVVGFAIGIFLVLLSVPGIIGGIGLLKRKEWARILVLITSALHLLNFPIGTAIGGYSIWVLVNTETIRLFNPIVPPPPAQT
jgi:O-antigen/teichoic acid export membrane protein